MCAVAEAALAGGIGNQRKRLGKATLVSHQRKAAQARLVHDHAGTRERDHPARDGRVPARVIGLAHRTGLQNLPAEKCVEQRGLSRAGFAQHDGHRALGHQRPDGTLAPAGAGGLHGILQPLARDAIAIGCARAGNDHGDVLAKHVAKQGDVGRKGTCARGTVGLREDYRRRGTAIHRNHDRADDTVELDPTVGDRLGHQHHVDVGGKRLALAAVAAAPTRYVTLARQDLLDNAHVMRLGPAHGNPIADGGASGLVLGELGRELGPEGPVGAGDGGKAPVQAHDAPHRELLGGNACRGRLGNRGVKRDALGVGRHKLVEARQVGHAK